VVCVAGMLGVIRSGDGSCISCDGLRSSAIHLICFSGIVPPVVIDPTVHKNNTVRQIALIFLYLFFIECSSGDYYDGENIRKNCFVFWTKRKYYEKIFVEHFKILLNSVFTTVSSLSTKNQLFFLNVY